MQTFTNYFNYFVNLKKLTVILTFLNFLANSWFFK